MAELGALSEIERAMVKSVFELKEFFGLLLGVAIADTQADGGFVLTSQEGNKTIKISKDVPSSIMEKIENTSSIEKELGNFSFITQAIAQDGVIVLMKSTDKPAFEDNNKRLLLTFAHRMELALKHAHSFQMMLDDYLGTLKILVESMDTRDPLTKEHSERIAHYASLVAKELGLADDEIEGIKMAALLHDVGMCGIADQILHKPGKFTDYEYETMKNHAQIGATLAEPIKHPIDLAPLIRGHHERYDGWGYPDGLRGNDIPLGARILALADSFNAKIEKRAYRNPLPLDEAVKQIENASGTQFDPQVVKAFLEAAKKI